MKTLIAVDGSEGAWDAVTFAAENLGSDNDTMVVNVATRLEPYVVPTGGLGAYAAGGYAGYYTPMNREEAIGSAAHQQVRKLEDRARTKADEAASEVNADVSAVEIGDPVERVCSVAEENDIDLIVVGTRDPGLFERIFTGGSVSRDIVNKAPCSVLVVR